MPDGQPPSGGQIGGVAERVYDDELMYDDPHRRLIRLWATPAHHLNQ
jgi:hypothetical protein